MLLSFPADSSTLSKVEKILKHEGYSLDDLGDIGKAIVPPAPEDHLHFRMADVLSAKAVDSLRAIEGLIIY